MIRTGDPERDFREHDREQQERLERLPKCDICGEPIQEDYFFEDGCMRICDGCWHDYVQANFVKNVEE